MNVIIFLDVLVNLRALGWQIVTIWKIYSTQDTGSQLTTWKSKSANEIGLNWGDRLIIFAHYAFLVMICQSRAFNLHETKMIRNLTPPKWSMKVLHLTIVHISPRISQKSNYLSLVFYFWLTSFLIRIVFLWIAPWN